MNDMKNMDIELDTYRDPNEYIKFLSSSDKNTRDKYIKNFIDRESAKFQKEFLDFLSNKIQDFLNNKTELSSTESDEQIKILKTVVILYEIPKIITAKDNTTKKIYAIPEIVGTINNNNKFIEAIKNSLQRCLENEDLLKFIIEKEKFFTKYFLEEKVNFPLDKIKESSIENKKRLFKDNRWIFINLTDIHLSIIIELSKHSSKSYLDVVQKYNSEYKSILPELIKVGEKYRYLEMYDFLAIKNINLKFVEDYFDEKYLEMGHFSITYIKYKFILETYYFTKAYNLEQTSEHIIKRENLFRLFQVINFHDYLKIVKMVASDSSIKKFFLEFFDSLANTLIENESYAKLLVLYIYYDVVMLYLTEEMPSILNKIYEIKKDDYYDIIFRELFYHQEKQHIENLLVLHIKSMIELGNFEKFFEVVKGCENRGMFSRVFHVFRELIKEEIIKLKDKLSDEVVCNLLWNIDKLGLLFRDKELEFFQEKAFNFLHGKISQLEKEPIYEEVLEIIIKFHNKIAIPRTFNKSYDNYIYDVITHAFDHYKGEAKEKDEKFFEAVFEIINTNVHHKTIKFFLLGKFSQKREQDFEKAFEYYKLALTADDIDSFSKHKPLIKFQIFTLYTEMIESAELALNEKQKESEPKIKIDADTKIQYAIPAFEYVKDGETEELRVARKIIILALLSKPNMEDIPTNQKLYEELLDINVLNQMIEYYDNVPLGKEFSEIKLKRIEKENLIFLEENKRLKEKKESKQEEDQFPKLGMEQHVDEQQIQYMKTQINLLESKVSELTENNKEQEKQITTLNEKNQQLKIENEELKEGSDHLMKVVEILQLELDSPKEEQENSKSNNRFFKR